MSLPDELKFKPGDFNGCSLHFGQLTAVVERANALLAERWEDYCDVKAAEQAMKGDTVPLSEVMRDLGLEDGN